MKKEKEIDEKKKYRREYYLKNRESIRKKAKEKYRKKYKGKHKCKMCGKDFPKEVSLHTRYCDKCLYGKGHGADAHRLASARWWRKKHLTKKGESK